jgi:hypothetical protein
VSGEVADALLRRCSASEHAEGDDGDDAEVGKGDGMPAHGVLRVAVSGSA